MQPLRSAPSSWKYGHALFKTILTTKSFCYYIFLDQSVIGNEWSCVLSVSLSDDGPDSGLSRLRDRQRYVVPSKS